jgi:GGDEF domain-containing protein
LFSNIVKLAAAQKYIRELQKKQKDPFGWPDYLTGLPGKSAILKKLETVYPRIGAYGVGYIRIANIYPYLIKYGYDKHAEIISWAAAILKSTSDKCREAFVGTMSTHDFVVMAKSKDLDAILFEASSLFGEKAKSYYSPADRKNGIILSFKLDDKRFCVGLMEFLTCSVKENPPVPRLRLIPHLAHSCSQMENTTLC